MNGLTLAAFADEASPEIGGQIRALRRNGIRFLELRGVGTKSCAQLTVAEAKELKKQLDDGGISVRTIGSPIGKIPVTAAFAPEEERFSRLTEIAGVLGADGMRVFSFYRDPAIDEAEGEEIAIRRLARLQECAGTLTLYHENEKGIYGDRPGFCEVLCRMLPRLRALFDPANFVQCGVDPLAAWERLSPFVDRMHLKDARADGTVVPCGEGAGQLPELLRRFSEQGGNFATVEPHLWSFASKRKLERAPLEDCGRYADADTAFDAAVGAVRELLKKEGVTER